MHGHPTGNANADGADLCGSGGAALGPRVAAPFRRARLVGPNADELRIAFDEASVDAVPPRKRDHDLREVSHVTAHVAAIGSEIEDRVRHELPRAVECHVSPPRGLVHSNAELVQPRARDQDVLVMRAAAEGHDRIVLEKKQSIADFASNARVEQVLLKSVRFAITDPAEKVSHEGAHLGRARNVVADGRHDRK